MKIKENLLRVYGLPLIIILALGGTFYLGTLYQARTGGVSSTIQVINNIGDTSTTTPVDMGIFWQVWKKLDEKFVGKNSKPSAEQKVWKAIQGLTQAYDDPYTVFMPPEESKNFETSIAGDFEGVGMEIGDKDGMLMVIAPLKGTPADRADVRSGDRILTINGTSTENMSADRAVKLIRGPKGTPVKIKFYREGKLDPFEKTIIRDTIDVPSVETEIKGDVFVIKVYNFYAKASEQFRDALQTFIDSKTSKLVIDLRGNPGGYLEAAVQMSSFFLPAGKVIVKEDRGANIDEVIHRSVGYDVFNDNLKMMILLNSGSASASEIFAGAMRDQGLAKIVGTKSFGKGSVQEVVPMSNNSSLKVTVARWLTPNGYSISESGLNPDYEVKMTEEDILKKRDPQMDKAIKLLDTVK